MGGFESVSGGARHGLVPSRGRQGQALSDSPVRAASASWQAAEVPINPDPQAFVDALEILERAQVQRKVRALAELFRFRV